MKEKEFFECLEGITKGSFEAKQKLNEYFANSSAKLEFKKFAADELKTKAKKGNIYAQGYLGWMYLQGWGVKQDLIEAEKRIRSAAEKGDRYSQNNIGWMHENSRGVPQSCGEAVKW